MRPECWFARLAGAGPCDGPMDRCHLVPKQRIKREFAAAAPSVLSEVVWHPSAWVWGCRRHHGNFDNKVLRIHRSQIPLRTERWAEVFGLQWSLDRDFGDPVVGVTTCEDGGW